MALTKKIDEFKKCFDIKNINKNITFIIDSKNNLYALFGQKKYILTNQRNTNKFLSYDTMKFKKNYGVEFLRAVGIERAKTTTEQINAKKDLHEKMITLFKWSNLIGPDFDLSAITYVEGDKLYTDFEDKKVLLFSCGKPELIINRGRIALRQKLGIDCAFRVEETHKCFTEDFVCNVPNIPNKEIKNKMQLLRCEDPPFNGAYYTKKYVSFLTSDNISDIFNEDLKSITQKNADVFQVKFIGLILKYEIYSGINDGAEKETPSIVDISSAVVYDNYDDFVSKIKEILTEKLAKFIERNKLEFCTPKLTSSCMIISYKLRPQNIPLF